MCDIILTVKAIVFVRSAEDSIAKNCREEFSLVGSRNRYRVKSILLKTIYLVLFVP